ncbi:MAG TPA: hypothetical protein VGA03_08660 [Anaerolineales bacterium]
MKRKVQLLVFLGLATLTLTAMSACGLVGTPQVPTPFPDSAYTAAAQTIIAQITETALAAPPTPGPSETTAADTPVAPTQTPTAEATGTLQPTDTPEIEDTPTGTPEPGTTSVPPGRLVFEDDFSDEGSWFTDQGDNFGFEYAQGGYRIYVNILNATIWSIRERDTSDVRLEVDGQRTSGARDGYYGLVCRHQDEEESYYALVVAEDGSYGIGKSEDGEFEFIETGTAESGVIRDGDEPNRVRADCIGDTLSLYANGQKLLEVQDDDFDSGFVGLVAGTRLTGEITVLFDNFAIYEP